ncbi:MAG: hypothetical protein GWM92_01985, partial [Gemmatimonadetes bacterium]|nr:hypothetical protein [Gemmatimonadota bacterium]NIR77247.1 hypothetical protein [Gemmatimonadota bacterium]NIT85766.1 hypothetical protein [Gemmatimonadota bacterium]NIU29591.1 hypothetical protein [Gemmatimonadota bacterium]NIU34640.1 hypothetical protein [Gemmatimonadota bacterium]
MPDVRAGTVAAGRGGRGAREAAELKFRDPVKARGLIRALETVSREVPHDPVSIMHVCGSHEQSIAKYGLRSVLPRSLNV